MEDNSLMDKLKDKNFRKKILMVFYLILILFLAYFIKSSPTPKTKKEPVKKEEEKEKDKIKVVNDERFALIKNNNYNFDFVYTFNDTVTTFKGKRYDNKYSFEMNRGEEKKILIGTESLLKDENNLSTSVFPYYIVNYFNNSLLEGIIANSKGNENIYEITNEKLNALLEIDIKLTNPAGINKVSIIAKNNYITEYFFDYSEYAKEHDKAVEISKVTLKYSNFFVVDNFSTK